MEIILGVNREGVKDESSLKLLTTYPALSPYFLHSNYSRHKTEMTHTIDMLKGSAVKYTNKSINYLITIMYHIINYSIQCKIITERKNMIKYIVFADRRLGAISIDSNNPSFPDAYKKATKHRFDMDSIFKASTAEEALFSIYDFTNSFVSWVNQRDYFDGIVVYHDSIKDYVAFKIKPPEGYKELYSSENLEIKIANLKSKLFSEAIGLTYEEIDKKFLASSSYLSLVNVEIVGNLKLKNKGDANVLQL